MVNKTESRKRNKRKGFVIGFVGKKKSKQKKVRMRELTNFNEIIALEQI